MGYIHYFKLKENSISQRRWDRFIKDVKKIRKHLPKHSYSSGGYFKDEPLYLNGCCYNRNAIFDSEQILFNGGMIPASKRVKNCKQKFPNSEIKFDIDELANQTFHLDIEGNCLGFCKTSRKPYDLMVQCVIILAKHHFTREFSFSSDGDVDEWLSAYKLVSKYVDITPYVMESLCLVDDAERESLKIFIFEK